VATCIFVTLFREKEARCLSTYGSSNLHINKQELTQSLVRSALYLY